MIYQHATEATDQAIADALDQRIKEPPQHRRGQPG
jgi:hypothetical protein